MKNKRLEKAMLSFKERTCPNKVARVIYLILKIFYMSYWFYWGGFTVLWFSYINPFSGQTFRDIKKDDFELYVTKNGGETAKWNA